MKKALRIYKYAWVVPFFAMVVSMFASLFNDAPLGRQKAFYLNPIDYLQKNE